MSRMLILAIALICLVTRSALAGGPPRLSLPIAGVSEENSEACTSILSAALADRLYTFRDADGVSVEKHGDQWYVVLYIKEDVRLSEITGALAETSFSVPTENSVLFDQAILEFEVSAGSDSFEREVGSLTPLQSAQIEDVQRDGDTVVVTIFTPEVSGLGQDLSHVLSNPVVEDLLTCEGGESEALPRYSGLDAASTPFNASLQDIRWSASWGCTAFGLIALPE